MFMWQYKSKLPIGHFGACTVFEFLKDSKIRCLFSIVHVVGGMTVDELRSLKVATDFYLNVSNTPSKTPKVR